MTIYVKSNVSGNYRWGNKKLGDRGAAHRLNEQTGINIRFLYNVQKYNNKGGDIAHRLGSIKTHKELHIIIRKNTKTMVYEAYCKPYWHTLWSGL